MEAISKVSDFKPASFSNEFSKVTLGVRFVCELVNDSLSNNIPITKDIILDKFADYVYAKNGKFVKEVNGGLRTYSDGKQYIQWIKQEITKEEWVKKYYRKAESLQWFQRNLGSAIVKGKFVIIPVIEI